jgi:hypothetical protein
MAGRFAGVRTAAGRAAGGAAQTVRRGWPFVLEAYRRWQALPEHEKERYRQRARDLADGGRNAIEAVRRRRGR